MKPTAKRIVLELLSAADDHESTAALLVAAAKLLGVAENNLRVALTRMVADGTLELHGRGVYRLGKATQAMTRQVTSWRELEKHVRRWDGGWACVQVTSADRTVARRRDRALRLLGFRELAGALHVRPDNLDLGIAGLRDRLADLSLGLAPETLVFRATDFDDLTEARARGLWDRDRLSATYVHTRERIERWLVAIQELPLRTAAREAFFFGGDVLRMILFDPRLPEPLVDVTARRALVEAATRLDTAGRRLWARLVGMQQGMVITPEVTDELVH